MVFCHLKQTKIKEHFHSIIKNANCGFGKHERVVQISKKGTIKKKQDFKHTINALMRLLKRRKSEASRILFDNENQFTFYYMRVS